MDVSQQQEQFSNAYLHAVATVAGCTIATPGVDDDSIDFTISTKEFSARPKLDVQIKCYIQDACIGSNGFSYQLKMKNYDDLRITDILVPRILVVVVVPRTVTDWLSHSDEQTLMKFCGYWTSIRGKIDSANKQTVSVNLPQANRFTADSLRSLLQIVASGGAP